MLRKNCMEYNEFTKIHRASPLICENYGLTPRFCAVISGTGQLAKQCTVLQGSGRHAEIKIRRLRYVGVRVPAKPRFYYSLCSTLIGNKRGRHISHRVCQLQLKLGHLGALSNQYQARTRPKFGCLLKILLRRQALKSYAQITIFTLFGNSRIT